MLMLNRIWRRALIWKAWVQLLVLLAIPAAAAVLSSMMHDYQKQKYVLKHYGPIIDAMHSAPVTVWLDARSPAARLARPMVWAHPLTPELWEQELPGVMAAWRPDAVLLVFCNGGGCDRSQDVAERFKRETQLGKVFVIDGGDQDARWLYSHQHAR